jgi:hypothetical protein
MQVDFRPVVQAIAIGIGRQRIQPHPLEQIARSHKFRSGIRPLAAVFHQHRMIFRRTAIRLAAGGRTEVEEIAAVSFQ